MEEVQNRKKSKAMSFDGLGIAVGTVLTYRKSEHTCTVVDTKNRVEYEGKVYTLSGLAKQLVGTNASGFATFYLNGVKLSDIAQKMPTAAEIAPKQAIDSEQSQDNTQTAEQAAVAATGQDAGHTDCGNTTEEAVTNEANAESESETANDEAFDIF